MGRYFFLSSIFSYQTMKMDVITYPPDVLISINNIVRTSSDHDGGSRINGFDDWQKNDKWCFLIESFWRNDTGIFVSLWVCEHPCKDYREDLSMSIHSHVCVTKFMNSIRYQAKIGLLSHIFVKYLLTMIEYVLVKSFRENINKINT